MKIEVRYQSLGGNTKRVAEEISKYLDVTAKSIDNEINEKIDYLFIGGGVYKFGIDESLSMYIDKLDNKKIGMIVPFSTCAGFNLINKTIREKSIEKNIPVYDKDLCIKFGFSGFKLFGLKGVKINREQINQIKEFIDEFNKYKENN